MPPIQTSISHLLRSSLRRGEAYVRTISPDLSDKTQQRTGLVLGVIRMDASPAVGNVLVAHIEDALIRGLSEALRRLPESAGQEAVFEAAMTKVNDSLSRVIGERRLAVRLEDIDGVIMAQKGVEVVAAAWGQPTVLLFHPTKDQKIKVYDLLEEESSKKDVTAAKASGRGFLHLITGRVGCGDRMFICTEDLRSTLGPAELAPIIADNDPEAATAILNEVFDAHKAEGALALFVTDATECDPGGDAGGERPAKRLSSATQRSIEKLLNTESDTRNIMQPAILPSLAKNIGKAAVDGFKAAASVFRPKPVEDAGVEETATPADGGTAADEPAAETGLETPPADDQAVVQPEALAAEPPEAIPFPEEEYAEPEVQPAPEPKTAPPTEPAPKMPSKAAVFAAGLGRALRTAVSAAKNAALTLASKERRRAGWQGVKDGADRRLTVAVERYNGLPAASRYILLSLLAVIFVFNSSLTVAGWQRQREEVVAAYDRTTAAVRQKIDSAEASLIYRDEVRARELLGEAEMMIAAMPGRKQEQKALKEALTKRVQSGYQAVRREVRLGAPEVVAGITTSAATPVLTRLAAAGGIVWAASDRGEIFKVTLKDGAAAKTGDVPGGGSPAVFLVSGDALLAGDKAGKMTSIRAGAASAKDIELGKTEAVIVDGEIYNGRLYLLDPTHNRILRVDPAGQGFGQPQFYLRDGTDVSGAVSLAIDGLVYVLLGDGSIARLVKGTRDSFAVGRVDPAIKAPTRIRSWAESEYVYVLDGAPARLISYDKKTGALAAQYVSESLQGAADFLVDEKDRTVLVAVGNNLLRFSLPEMK